MATQKKTFECPKCGGSGNIPAFSGIACGVCFRCNGSGKVLYRVSKKVVRPLSDHEAKWNEAIRSADFSIWGYNHLLFARNFAHGCPTPYFPNILEVWRARGEAFFQAAQEERLQEFYANR